jgi:hypothetical protein
MFDDRTPDRGSSSFDSSTEENEMRYITLAAATLATLAFAGAAQADSNYGPRQKGNQCWHAQLRNGDLGYWAPCQPSQNAQATRTNASGNAANAPANGNTRRR